MTSTTTPTHSTRELPGPGVSDLPWMAWEFARHGDKVIDRLFDRHGDILGVRVPDVLDGVGRVALVRDASVIKTLFTSPDSELDATKANHVLEMLYGSRSLFLIDGPDHRRLRKVLLPRLRGETLQQWQDAIVTGVEREVATWPDRPEVRMHPRMLDLSLELILHITLGIPVEELPKWKPPMTELLEIAVSEQTLMRYLVRRAGGLRFWPRFQRALAQCEDLVYDEIRRRRTTGTRDRSDLLDLLMHIDGTPLTDRELRDQIFTVLIAGHETSATAASWAVERLLRNRDAFDRAIAEARGDGGHDYLDAVVHETLRMRPPIAVVGRVTRTTVTVGGFRIAPGTVIVPMIRAVHQQSSLYEEPEKFSPERFLGRRPGPYTMIAFGGGQHRCLGDHLALFQTRLILQTILRNLDVTAVDTADEPVTRKAIAYVPGHGTRLRAARL